MSYHSISLLALHQDFKLTIKQQNLSNSYQIEPITPSDKLIKIVKQSNKTTITTEKELLDYIMLPILSEVETNSEGHLYLFPNKKVSIGNTPDLMGKIDFVFARVINTLDVELPFLCVVSAVLYKGIDKAIAQIAIQMLAIQAHNQTNRYKLPIVYGVIVYRRTWTVLQLFRRQLTIDTKKYAVDDLSSILGLFQRILY